MKEESCHFDRYGGSSVDTLTITKDNSVLCTNYSFSSKDEEERLLIIFYHDSLHYRTLLFDLSYKL